MQTKNRTLKQSQGGSTAPVLGKKLMKGLIGALFAVAAIILFSGQVNAQGNYWVPLVMG
jgi:hypothetical protein